MRRVFILIFPIVMFAGLALAQSSVTPDSAATNTSQAVPDPKDAVPDAKSAGAVVEDATGRPVQTSPTPEVPPPPTALPEQQDFQQNVKDVYFDFNRADLTNDDRSALEKDAEWLKAHPNVHFTIAGGADERGATSLARGTAPALCRLL